MSENKEEKQKGFDIYTTYSHIEGYNVIPIPVPKSDMNDKEKKRG